MIHTFSQNRWCWPMMAEASLERTRIMNTEHINESFLRITQQL